MKLLAHRAGLPGNVISFYIVPLYPAHKTGLAGHLPAKTDSHGISFEVKRCLKRSSVS